MSNPNGRVTHGKSRTPEHRAWQNMKDRCLNRSGKNWKDYGGRGLTVCKRWLRFEAFLSDLGPRPSAAHTLERIRNNVGYRPSNCKWATRSEQGRNKRNNRRLTLNGTTRTLAEWAEKIGLSESCIRRRIKLGWPLTKALHV